MVTAEKASKDSAQSPACSRKALPAATCPAAAVSAAGLAGEHQRREGGDLLECALEGGLVGPVGLLRGRVGRARMDGGPVPSRAPACRLRRPGNSWSGHEAGVAFQGQTVIRECAGRVAKGAGRPPSGVGGTGSAASGRAGGRRCGRDPDVVLRPADGALHERGGPLRRDTELFAHLPVALARRRSRPKRAFDGVRAR